MYEEAYTPFEWHEELFEHAKKVGITLFSTPFDETAVDLLESLNTPAYKIASFEIIDLPLLEYVSSKQKPIFLSTGMASKDEIEEAVNTIRKISDNEILLFHCISSYPTPTEKSHLRNIYYLREKFGVKVGLSDHTFSNLAAIVAIGMGAVAIEKHFKLDQEDCGPDSSFSLDVTQLSELVNDCNMAWSAKGETSFRRADIEKDNKVFRRSLYFINNLTKGDKIKESDIRRIRPGYGLSPKHYNEIIGKELTKSVEKGDPVSWDDFS